MPYTLPKLKPPYLALAAFGLVAGGVFHRRLACVRDCVFAMITKP